MFGSVVSAQATGSSWRRNFDCRKMENGLFFTRPDVQTPSVFSDNNLDSVRKV